MLSLSKSEPDNPNEHFTLRIQSPWSERGFCTLQFPELAYVALSEFCLLHYMGREGTHLQPLEFPELSFGPRGESASFALKYPSGVTFDAVAWIVGNDTMEMRLTVKNPSPRFFPGIDFAACLKLAPMGDAFAGADPTLKVFKSAGRLMSFDDLHYADGAALGEKDKTYAQISCEGTPGVYQQHWCNGDWIENDRLILEKASLPFIARKSATEDRFVAIFWPRARYVMSNAGLSCLHADPTIPNCPGGETVSIHGRIIFHEGNAESLLSRIERELDELALKDKVWTQWHV